MRTAAAAALLAVIATTAAATFARAAEEYELPPEVTPSMRAACESDVRRLCIGQNPSVDKVKACVQRKFTQLGRKCQMELASAGFGG